MSSDGHLTQSDIREIRKWKIHGSKKLTLKNLIKLLNLIENACLWPDFCIDYELGTDILGNMVVRMYYSTGGWSGHEHLISELENTWFWVFCWQRSRRGGHYIFEINPITMGEDDE